MILEVKKENKELINQLFETFNNYFKNINSLLADFDNNPFSKYYIYCEDNNILGFLNYYDLYDRYEISYIEVLNSYRNKKIASKMIEHLIFYGEHKKIKNITLEVNEKNYIAINLYKKYNFGIVAIREKYYNGVDAFLMERKMM